LTPEQAKIAWRQENDIRQPDEMWHRKAKIGQTGP
jgi:hypothetical protein